MTDPCPHTTAENLEARCAELTAALSAQPLSDRGRAALLYDLERLLSLHGETKAAEIVRDYRVS